MAWADRRLMERLKAAPAARTARAVRLFAHVLAAERVWLLRLRGEDSGVQPVWPDASFEELEPMAAVSREGYARYLEGASEEALEAEIEYRTQRGDPYRTRASDILLHVALHGAYHRGQIAAEIREAGEDPAKDKATTTAMR
jgi:uncharacterized damage-inducible protein DinB